jgi:hypothetical protein
VSNIKVDRKKEGGGNIGYNEMCQSRILRWGQVNTVINLWVLGQLLVDKLSDCSL